MPALYEFSVRQQALRSGITGVRLRLAALALSFVGGAKGRGGGARRCMAAVRLFFGLNAQNYSTPCFIDSSTSALQFSSIPHKPISLDVDWLGAHVSRSVAVSALDSDALGRVTNT